MKKRASLLADAGSPPSLVLYPTLIRLVRTPADIVDLGQGCLEIVGGGVAQEDPADDADTGHQLRSPASR